MTLYHNPHQDPSDSQGNPFPWLPRGGADVTGATVPPRTL